MLSTQGTDALPNVKLGMDVDLAEIEKGGLPCFRSIFQNIFHLIRSVLLSWKELHCHVVQQACEDLTKDGHHRPEIPVALNQSWCRAFWLVSQWAAWIWLQLQVAMAQIWNDWTPYGFLTVSFWMPFFTSATALCFNPHSEKTKQFLNDLCLYLHLSIINCWIN